MRDRERAMNGAAPERFLKRKTLGDGSVELTVRLTADEAELAMKALREARRAMGGNDSSAGETADAHADAPHEQEQRGQHAADAFMSLVHSFMAGARGACRDAREEESASAMQSASNGGDRTQLLADER